MMYELWRDNTLVYASQSEKDFNRVKLNFENKFPNVRFYIKRISTGGKILKKSIT